MYLNCWSPWNEYYFILWNFTFVKQEYIWWAPFPFFPNRPQSSDKQNNKCATACGCTQEWILTSSLKIQKVSNGGTEQCMKFSNPNVLFFFFSNLMRMCVYPGYDALTVHQERNRCVIIDVCRSGVRPIIGHCHNVSFPSYLIFRNIL